MGYSDFDPAIHNLRLRNLWQTVGTKPPLLTRDIWASRFFLDEHKRFRDRDLFDLAIDSKLRSCNLVKLKIGDFITAGQFRNHPTIIQQKTGRPVQFEIIAEARRSLEVWLGHRGGLSARFRVSKPH